MNTPETTKFKFTKKLSNLTVLPRILVNLLRSKEEIEILDKKYSGFDSLNVAVSLISKRFNELKNIIKDINSTLDRYDILIQEKNKKIDFYSYSETFPENDKINPFLKKSILVSTEEVQGILVDEDSGIEIQEIKEDQTNYIKFNFDETKLKGINFHSTSDSSIRIVWDDDINAYKVEQNQLLVYQSEEPETEVIINHNLGTKGIDVKTFKVFENDIDLRYPIVPGIEFPSDNQIRLYLTEPILVHVLISRL